MPAAMIEKFFNEQYQKLAYKLYQNPTKNFQEILDELSSDDYLFKKKIFVYHNINGKTFLHKAVIENNFRLVEFLLAAGFLKSIVSIRMARVLFFQLAMKGHSRGMFLLVDCCFIFLILLLLKDKQNGENIITS